MSSRADRAIQMVRVDPKADINALIAEDASEMVGRVLESAAISTKRRHMIEFVRGVYAAAAEVITREVRLRVTASLDAADSDARHNGLRTKLIEFVTEVHDGIPGDAWDEETRARVEADPVAYLRDILGYSTVMAATEEVDNR